MEERIINSEELAGESLDENLRPSSLDEYIGQEEIKENLTFQVSEKVMLQET